MSTQSKRIVKRGYLFDRKGLLVCFTFSSASDLSYLCRIASVGMFCIRMWVLGCV